MESRVRPMARPDRTGRADHVRQRTIYYTLWLSVEGNLGFIPRNVVCCETSLMVNINKEETKLLQ